MLERSHNILKKGRSQIAEPVSVNLGKKGDQLVVLQAQRGKLQPTEQFYNNKNDKSVKRHSYPPTPLFLKEGKKSSKLSAGLEALKALISWGSFNVQVIAILFTFQHRSSVISL